MKASMGAIQHTSGPQRPARSPLPETTEARSPLVSDAPSPLQGPSHTQGTTQQHVSPGVWAPSAAGQSHEHAAFEASCSRTRAAWSACCPASLQTGHELRGAPTHRSDAEALRSPTAARRSPPAASPGSRYSGQVQSSPLPYDTTTHLTARSFRFTSSTLNSYPLSDLLTQRYYSVPGLHR